MVTDFLRSERYFGLFSLCYVLSVLDGYIVASAIVRFKVKRRIPRFRMREHLSTEPSLYGNLSRSAPVNRKAVAIAF